MNILKKTERWFDLNLGSFFINGRKQEEWYQYLRDQYKTKDAHKLEEEGVSNYTLNKLTESFDINDPFVVAVCLMVRKFKQINELDKLPRNFKLKK